MVDHNDPWKFLQERCQVGKVGRLEIDDDMPAEPLHPFGGAKEQLARCRITSRLTKLNLTPRTPAASMLSSSSSEMSCATTATPRAMPPEA